MSRKWPVQWRPSKATCPPEGRRQSLQALAKIYRPSILVNFLEFQRPGDYQEIPSRTEDNVMCLAPPTIKKETQHLVGLFEFCRHHVPTPGKKGLAQIPGNLATLVWSPEQERAPWQVQARPAALLLESCGTCGTEHRQKAHAGCSSRWSDPCFTPTCHTAISAPQATYCHVTSS